MQTDHLEMANHYMQSEQSTIRHRRLIAINFIISMAKILFSGIAGVDMRNKLNGSVFSKNRYGGYVRTKVTPVNPQSTAQQAARNRLSTNSQAWRGLTESQRQSWIDGAINYPFTDIYGNTKTLSGQALYVKFNNNLALVGIASIDACPSPIALPAVTVSNLIADVSAQTVIFEFEPTPPGADLSLVVFATPMVTPGKSFVKNLFRYVTIVGSAGASPADISAAYIAKFGPIVLGQKVFIRAFMISELTGQAGIPVQVQTIAIA